MAYCTSADVALYININQGDVEGAIAAAQDKIDRYTNDIFETRALSVYTETTRAGMAELPYTTQSVAEVKVLPNKILLDSGAYTLENYSRPILRIVANNIYSLTIAGMEPYNYTGTYNKLRLEVTGVFGYSETPFQVRNATALLAAYYLSLAGFGELKEKALEIIGAPINVASISVEGYNVSYRDTNPEDFASSTGIAGIDRFLAPYKRVHRLRGN